MAILQFHVVSTDMLSDTTSLTGNYIGIADMVEQRSLTMIDMTHHRYDRRTADQVVLVIHLLSNSVLHLSTDILCSEAELLGNDIDGLSIQTLVN